MFAGRKIKQSSKATKKYPWFFKYIDSLHSWQIMLNIPILLYGKYKFWSIWKQNSKKNQEVMDIRVVQKADTSKDLQFGELLWISRFRY